MHGPNATEMRRVEGKTRRTGWSWVAVAEEVPKLVPVRVIVHLSALGGGVDALG